MCRKRALLATVLAPVLLMGASAHAADAPAKAAAPQAEAQAAMAPPRKASPAQRAEARRMDPLARAAFWGSEFENDNRDVEAGVALTQALRALGRYDEAIATIAKVIVVDPNTVEGSAGAGSRPDRARPGLLRHRAGPPRRRPGAARLASAIVAGRRL
jgi:Flp pilus assembly protein TadD